MKKQITINKEWYDRLVIILDELNKQIKLNDKCVETHCWLFHLMNGGIKELNGYIRSLDEFFKD